MRRRLAHPIVITVTAVGAHALAAACGGASVDGNGGPGDAAQSDGAAPPDGGDAAPPDGGGTSCSAAPPNIHYDTCDFLQVLRDLPQRAARERVRVRWATLDGPARALRQALRRVHRRNRLRTGQLAWPVQPAVQPARPLSVDPSRARRHVQPGWLRRRPVRVRVSLRSRWRGGLARRPLRLQRGRGAHLVAARRLRVKQLGHSCRR